MFRDVTLSPVAAPALAVLADVTALTGVSDADAAHTAAIAVASQIAEDYCNTILGERTVTEIVDISEPCGNLLLRHAPTGVLTSVTRDGAAVSPSLFRVSRSIGTIRKVDGSPIETGEWQFVYLAGYAAASIPPVVARAVAELSRAIYNHMSAGNDTGLTQEQVPDVASVSRVAGGMWSEQTAARGPTGVMVPFVVSSMLQPYVMRFAP